MLVLDNYNIFVRRNTIDHPTFFIISKTDSGHPK